MQLTAIVKRDCETCQMVVPVLSRMANEHSLTLYTQDDQPSRALGGGRDDTNLEQSWRFDIDTVPTIIAMDNGVEIDRAVGTAKNGNG